MKPFVLFVCRHNTGRSQMGTVPAEKPEPIVVEAMMQDGMDITDARPKLIDPQTASRADLIVTMGCDVQGVPRVDEDWGLPEKA